MLSSYPYGPLVELSDYLSPEVCDNVYRAMESVILSSESLALDDDQDCQELMRRLKYALGLAAAE